MLYDPYTRWVVKRSVENQTQNAGIAGVCMTLALPLLVPESVLDATPTNGSKANGRGGEKH